MVLKKKAPIDLVPKTTPATNDEIVGLDAVTNKLVRIPQKNVGESPFQKTDTTISPKAEGDNLDMLGGGFINYRTKGIYISGTGDASIESSIESGVPYLIQNPLAGNSRTITIPDAQNVTLGIVAAFYLDGESANTGQVLIKTTNNQQINRDIIQVISSPGTGFTIQEFMGEWLIKQDNRPQPGAESIFLYPTLALVTNPSLDPTYLKLTNDTSDPDYPQTEQIATGPVVGPTEGVPVLQGVWTTDTSVIQTTFQGTEAKITTKLNITSGTGAELVSYAELYKRDALGVETLINTSLPTTVHIVDQVLYIFTIYIPPQTTIIDGEFLVWKFYAEKVGGQPSDTNQVQFAVGGFEDPARIGLPVPVGGFKVGINDVAGLSDELERLDNMPLILSQFDSSTTMSDPGAGKFRLNAGQTQLALNYQEPSGSNIKIHANKLSDGSTLKLQVKGDDSKYKNINVTGITDNTTWTLIDITVDNEGNAFVLDDIAGIIIVGGSGANIESVEKNPFTETIEIANLKQHSPLFTPTPGTTLNIVKGVTSTFISGEYTAILELDNNTLSFSNDFITFGESYANLTGTYVFKYEYLSNGQIIVIGLDTEGVPQLITPTLDQLNVTSTTSLTAIWTSNNPTGNISSITVEYDTVNTFDSPNFGEITGILNTATQQLIESLLVSTLYYCRVKLIGDGVNYLDSNYSNVLNQTTGSIVAPTVTTQAVTAITSTTATGNGNITDLGGENATAHGVVYSTSPNPTLADSVVDNGAASATGAFTANITGLTNGQTYYVRAFATNSVGTSYGDEVNFVASETEITPTFTLSGMTGPDGNNDYTGTGSGFNCFGVASETVTNDGAVIIDKELDAGQASNGVGLDEDSTNESYLTQQWVMQQTGDNALEVFSNGTSEGTYTIGAYTRLAIFVEGTVILGKGWDGAAWITIHTFSQAGSASTKYMKINCFTGLKVRNPKMIQ